MKKMMAYNVRPNEKVLFEKFSKIYEIEVTTTTESPSVENIKNAAGYDCVSVITTDIHEGIIDAFHEAGIRSINTRTIGIEHVAYDYAAKLGIPVSNVNYSAGSVAEYTIMMMLMSLRKAKAMMYRFISQDFGLREFQGRELSNMTVGVVGTGRIGTKVIQFLQGFGCKVLAVDEYPNDTVKAMAEYVDLETVWKECDIVTFHVPATDSSHHMVNRESIQKMKDGVILINTARGTIIDTEALIDALEEGKIGAAAFDVVDGDMPYYFHSFRYEPIKERNISILQMMPNVLLLPHAAFCTDQAASDMVEHSIQNCLADLNGQENPFIVNGVKVR